MTLSQHEHEGLEDLTMTFISHLRLVTVE